MRSPMRSSMLLFLRSFCALQLLFVLATPLQAAPSAPAQSYQRALRMLRAGPEAAAQRRATPLLESACGGGHQPACNALASLLMAELEGLPEGERARLSTARHGASALQLRRALSLYEGACDGGYSVACDNLAQSYAEGRIVRRDERYAIRFAARGCALDELNSCLLQAELLWRDGQGERRAEREVLSLWEKSCRGALALGCLRLARYYESRRGSVEERLSLDFARTGCESGSGEACVLASARLEAAGDQRGALSLLERACAGEQVAGCAALAERLRALGRDPRPLLRRGCEGRALRCCALLAGSLREEGAAETLPEARRLAELSCEAGVADGCYQLARLVQQGSAGLRQDPARAQALARRACRGGVRAGCALIIGR